MAAVRPHQGKSSSTNTGPRQQRAWVTEDPRRSSSEGHTLAHRAEDGGSNKMVAEQQDPQVPVPSDSTSSDSLSQFHALPNKSTPSVPAMPQQPQQQVEQQRHARHHPAHPHSGAHHHAGPPPSFPADSTHYMAAPTHGLSASIPPDQLRYTQQGGYGTLRPVYPQQLYYDPSAMTPDFVDPAHHAAAAAAAAHGVYPGMPGRSQSVSGYSPQAPVPPYHPAATTPPVPQGQWTGSAMAQPFYGSYGGMAPPPGAPQHTTQGPMGDDLGHGRSVYLGPGPPSAWSASPVISSPYQFFTPYQAASPQLDRIEQMSPTAEPWTPQTATQARPPRPGFVPHGGGAWSAQHPNAAGQPKRGSWTGADDEAAKAAARQAAAEQRERKEYHPQPPPRRSEWVMWVGNVPSNVSHEELWRFFNTTVPAGVNTAGQTSAEPWRGPSSIFLISRSSCAFVNFSSQADLDRAVPYFNGLSLRPWDARCPRMVCRVRHKDDDLRAGVGGQRGVGMHRAWVEQHKQQQQSESRRQSSTSLSVSPKATLLELPDGEHSNHDSSSAHKSSASFASTNSSFLAHHFPKRYFILKSLTQSDLEDSVKTGTWKTQRHNQPILDQAFRTSQEVILIFGANRSGEFFGYAKMVAPSNPRKMADNLRSSFSRKDSLAVAAPRGAPGDISKRRSQPAPIREEDDRGENRDASGNAIRSATDPFRSSGFLSTGDARAASPTALSPENLPLEHLQITQVHDDEPGLPRSESPDLMEENLRRSSVMTLDPNMLRAGDRKDSRLRLSINVQHSSSLQVHFGGNRKETRDRTMPPSEVIPESPDDSLAQPFQLQWLQVGPLSFSRTRHLRNPWNGDREVKVSRDGTEVEPGVGALLLAEWDKLESKGTPNTSSEDQEGGGS